jgi:DNA-binding response OmpR family regulator
MIAAPRILIVEDASGITCVLGDLPRSEGYEVVCADNGLEGQRLATTEKFDLVVLDVALPGLSGLGVAASLHNHGFAGKIVILSARGQAADKLAAREAGADCYIVKPFHPEELLEAFKGLLSGSVSLPPSVVVLNIP